MEPLRPALFCLLAGLSLHLPAQFLTPEGDVRLAVPVPPQVRSPIQKLLIAGAKEKESFQVARELQTLLAGHPGFQVTLPAEENVLGDGTVDFKPISQEQRTALAAKYGASHVMLLRLERFSFKEKKAREAIRTPTGILVHHKWSGFASGILHSPVLDLQTGEVTTIVPQNLFKEYVKEQDAVEPAPVPEDFGRQEVVRIASRRALQMVVPVRVVRTLPFMTQGDLDRPQKALREGKLEEALAQIQALAAGSAGDSAKYQSRIQYDLGLILCLSNRPAEGLEALRKAQATGYDKKEVAKALETCALLAPAPRS